ncbi:hypothetical protein Gpo141_00009267 [Globisporangium polare]
MALVTKSSLFGSSATNAVGKGRAGRVVAFEEQQHQLGEYHQTDAAVDESPTAVKQPDTSAAAAHTASAADMKSSSADGQHAKRVSSTTTARATVEAHRGDSRWQRKRVTLWKALLFLVDCTSTGLTLMTVLRENMLLVGFTGRYDSIRSRLAHGSINFNTIHNEIIDPKFVPSLEEISKTWRFYTLPSRSPATVNEDRSTCLRVNSISGNFMSINFDDFWGKGARRDQIYLFSISAFNCQVINFTPVWIKTNCTQQQPDNTWDDQAVLNSVSTVSGPASGDITSAAMNNSRCNRYILKHFNALKVDRTICTAVVKDPGIVGVPYLKCLGRADEQFRYLTDLMVFQSYWRGGPYHGEFQTSDCTALPVAKTKDLSYTLFQAAQVDQGVRVVAAFDQDNWLQYLASLAYSIMSILMIFRGLLRAILRTDIIQYVPRRARFRNFKSAIFSALRLSTIFPDDRREVLTFQGAVSLAPVEWMNHWAYSTVSIADAVANIRPTAMIFQLSVYMITFKMTFANFLFMFSAVTKMTWMICLLTSVLRIGVKLLLRLLRVTGLLRNSLMVRLEWYVDAANIFVSYKMYSVMLCVLLAILVEARKSTTFMVRQPNAKRANYGSVSDIAEFWESEIIDDFQVLFGIVLFWGLALGLFLVSCTKYHYVARNRVIRALQERYLFVGWDVFSTMENLGMDPFNETLVDSVEQCAMTNCSYGALIQQFSVSGPQGFLDFAGDDIFMPVGDDNSNSNGDDKQKALGLYYSPYKAMCMGLLDQKLQTTKRNAAIANTFAEDSPRETDDSFLDSTRGNHVVPVNGDSSSSPHDKRAPHWANHMFHLYVESRWGKVLLVDDAHRGRFVKNPHSHQFEYVVRDALTYIPEEDRHMLLGKDRRFRIR